MAEHPTSLREALGELGRDEVAIDAAQARVDLRLRLRRSRGARIGPRLALAAVAVMAVAALWLVPAEKASVVREPESASKAKSQHTRDAVPDGVASADEAAHSAAPLDSSPSSVASAKETAGPKAPASAASSRATGKLVAIASGGVCTFTIDGAGKGSGSSVTVEVSVGPHTVGCTPAGGGAIRTQRKTVEAGKPAMALFKLGS